MKARISLFILLFGFTLLTFAQKVQYQGKEYQVKGDRILLDKADITDQLSATERESILEALKIEKENKKIEKANKEAENKQKRAEKKQKKAEKELKKAEKAKDNYKDAQKKYDKELEKYEKLKRKGKLSPDDELKWLDKLDKLKKKIDKSKARL